MKTVPEKLRLLLAVAFVVNTLNSPAQAASAPTKITVQGRLTDPSGTPAPAGSKPFVFKIYDAATLGTEIWPNGAGENQNVNTDANGIWTAEVGSVIPLTSSVFNAPTRWLQITVNGETLSRIAINTTPFAYRVATLEGADGGEIGDTLGVRDPGGNVAVYGANGIAYSSSGGAETGPKGITFSTGSDTTIFLGFPFDHIPHLKLHSDTGTVEWPIVAGEERQLLLTTANIGTNTGNGVAGPALFMRDSSSGFLGSFSAGARGLTQKVWEDTLLHVDISNTSHLKLGVNTGHPTEALTVHGATRIGYSGDDPEPNPNPNVDPWIGVVRSIVVAKGIADEWGRSTDDSAGIFLPANTSDYSILSSKTSASQTILRMSVGDDPNDHILLMPSGNVGVGTTSPMEKLTVSGMIHSTSGGVKFPDASVQTSAAVNSGVAQAVGTNTVPDPFTTTEALLSVTISCPAGGFVLVMGSADIQVAHLNGSADFIDVGVSDSDTLFPADQRKEWVLPSTFPTATYLNPISSQKIFSVPSAGAYTFHLIGERVSGLGTATSLDRTLSAVYFPVSYGTVSLSGSGQGIPATAADTPLPSTPDEVTRIHQELTILRQEVEVLKSGLQR